MTDKQIIIDDVDVSGCVFYKDNGECSATTIWADYCKAMPECIYKLKNQLKAKEQECERFKKYFETAKEASNCNLKALGEMTEWADKLEQTLTEIKEIVCRLLIGGVRQEILQKIKEVEDGV